jgi:microbial collagenase
VGRSLASGRKGSHEAGPRPPHSEPWPISRRPAAFRVQPSAGTAPLPVTFTDQSKDSDGQVVAVRWDFGDGATSTERNPTHLYAAPGKFVVALTATDDNGATAEKTGKVEVRAK